MKKLLLSSALLTIFFAAPAGAVSKKISSPSDETGWEVENSGSVEWGDDHDTAWINKTELEYGFNNHFRVGIGAEIEKMEHDSLDYAATELEAAWRFTGDESSLQAAIEGGYEINHQGGPDEIEAKLLLAGAAYGLDHKANIALSREVGDDSDGGLGASFAWGSYYDMNGFDLGGEYYADFGNLSDNNGWSEQEHHLGPVVGFTVPVGARMVDVELGYLIGLSEASSDHVVKYEMGTSF